MDIQVKVLGYKLKIEVLNYVSYNTVTSKIKFFQKTGTLKSPRVDIKSYCYVLLANAILLESSVGLAKKKNLTL